jgi:hypothetical protein
LLFTGNYEEEKGSRQQGISTKFSHTKLPVGQ